MYLLDAVETDYRLDEAYFVDTSFFFINSVYRPFQDSFSSYETRQSVGGAKTGESREKPPDTPASRTWLFSHMPLVGLEPTPDTAVRCFVLGLFICMPYELRWMQFPTCSYMYIMPSHTANIDYCRPSTVFQPYPVQWLRCRKLI